MFENWGLNKTMKKTLKWRLGKLPTPEEVTSLVKDKIITNEEARQVLFSEETEESEKIEDLKREIEFLRELTEKLSSKSSIIETIRYIEKPYIKYPWYNPYMTWCTFTDNITTTGTGNYLSVTNDTTSYQSGALGTGVTNAIYASSVSGIGDSNFSSIKTF